MKKKISWIVAALIIIVVIVVMLSRTNASSQKTVKIGNILFVTGPLASLGEQELNGMKLAESDINANGGVKGKNVELVTQDYASDPKQAVPAYQFLKQQGIDFILVDGGSGVAPVVPLVRQNGDFSMVPVAITPSYLDDNQRTCRVALTAKDFALGIGGHISKQSDKPRVAFLVTANEYGKAVQTGVSDFITKSGGTIAEVETYDQSATDFRTEIVKLKGNQNNIDALVVINATNSVEPMLRQIKQLGFDKPIVSDLFTILNASLKDRTAADGIAFVDYPFVAEPQTGDSTELAHFKQEYYDKYKSYPSSASINGYDSVTLIARGMNNATELTPGAVANYLTQSMGVYHAVGGDLKFDSSCEVSRQAVMRQVVGKKLELIK